MLASTTFFFSSHGIRNLEIYHARENVLACTRKAVLSLLSLLWFEREVSPQAHARIQCLDVSWDLKKALAPSIELINRSVPYS